MNIYTYRMMQCRASRLHRQGGARYHPRTAILLIVGASVILWIVILTASIIGILLLAGGILCALPLRRHADVTTHRALALLFFFAALVYGALEILPVLEADAKNILASAGGGEPLRA